MDEKVRFEYNAMLKTTFKVVSSGYFPTVLSRNCLFGIVLPEEHSDGETLIRQQSLKDGCEL